MFGCVVVGVGIAGRARIRDLLAPLPSSAAEIFKLKGLVSRSVSFEIKCYIVQVMMEPPQSVCLTKITHMTYEW